MKTDFGVLVTFFELIGNFAFSSIFFSEQLNVKLEESLVIHE